MEPVWPSRVAAASANLCSSISRSSSTVSRSRSAAARDYRSPACGRSPRPRGEHGLPAKHDTHSGACVRAVVEVYGIELQAKGDTFGAHVDAAAGKHPEVVVAEFAHFAEQQMNIRSEQRIARSEHHLGTAQIRVDVV